MVKNDDASGRGRMIRSVSSCEMQDAETYRFWRGRTTAERMAAIDEIVRDAYAAKGIDVDALPSNRSIVRLDRA